MKDKDLFFVAPGVISVLSLVLFVIPGSLMLFSFSGTSFLNGEFWRIFTFPFVHINILHLIENLASLAVTVLLAYLVELNWKEFTISFLGSCLLLAFTEVVLFPTFVIAGASLGIFAVIGNISAKGSDFLPRYIFIPIVLSSIFAKYLFKAIIEGEIFTGTLLNQTILHFFGFASGILLFYIVGRYRTKKRVLTA